MFVANGYVQHANTKYHGLPNLSYHADTVPEDIKLPGLIGSEHGATFATKK